MGMGPPTGLDLTAFMLLGKARGIDEKLLSLIAPYAEAGIIEGIREQNNGDG